MNSFKAGKWYKNTARAYSAYGDRLFVLVNKGMRSGWSTQSVLYITGRSQIEFIEEWNDSLPMNWSMWSPNEKQCQTILKALFTKPMEWS